MVYPMAKRVPPLSELVEEFALNVAAQTDSKGPASVGNRFANRYIRSFQRLRRRGDAGRNALAVLFIHPLRDVRAMAAAFLLRHRTSEALSVLAQVAQGTDLTAFGAGQAIERWNEGTWALDLLENDLPKRRKL